MIIEHHLLLGVESLVKILKLNFVKNLMLNFGREFEV